MWFGSPLHELLASKLIVRKLSPEIHLHISFLCLPSSHAAYFPLVTGTKKLCLSTNHISFPLKLQLSLSPSNTGMGSSGQGKRAEVFMAQQWAVPLGTTQCWRALMKYIGTSINHCLSDYKMAVLKWLPGPAKTPSSYIPLVSHHFQSTFRGWEVIYARSLNRSKIKPLCVWVICQHPNHWDTPGNPGFFVVLAIYSTGYSNSYSYSYTAGVFPELSGQL